MKFNLQFITLKSVSSLFGITLLCWLTLYMKPERWQQIDENDVLTYNAGRYRRRIDSKSNEVSSQTLTVLRNFGKEKLYKIFHPIFSKKEKIQILKALKVLTDQLDAAGIGYFLYGGSLIGSWRHHDIIPWDDDIDIIVNISDALNIEKLKFPEHILNIHTLNRYKFYSRDAYNIPGYFWKWPYIDICFFGDNGTHIYDMDPTFSKQFVYDRNDILPLVKRPFGGLTLKSPKNAEKILEQNYNMKDCQTPSYDHKKQKSIPTSNVTTVDCRVLHRIYPFVRRDQPSRAIEKLYHDRELIDTKDVQSLNN